MPYEALPTTGQAYPQASPLNLDYSTEDAKKQILNNLKSGTDQGNQLMQYLQNTSVNQGQAADYWGRQAAESYGDLSGYSPEEQSNIIREQELKGAMTTGDQYNQMYLDSGEMNAMMGDPSSYRTLNAAGLNTLDSTGNANILGAQNDLASGLTAATGQHAGLYEGAVDPSKMSMASSYAPGVEADLAAGGSAIRSTIDPTKLSLSNAFTDNYGLTPEMQQEMVNQAGRTVGTRYAALQDSAAAQAAAQGNTSPMAVAAHAARLNAQEAGVAGDTMANARLAASTEAANRLKTQEQMRLDAERGISSAQTGVEQGLLATGLGARQSTESMRLGSEQELSSQIMARAQQLGISYEDAAKTIGASGINTQQDIRNSGLSTAKYINEQASEQNRAADEAQAARSAALATNRQSTAQYIPAQQWSQGSAANTALSSRYTGVADQAQALEKERRAFETGQQSYYGTNAQDTNKTLTSAYGAKTGAANEAAGQTARYDTEMAKVPSLWEKVVGAGVEVAKAAQPYSSSSTKKPGQV